jgi:hypothetical protein
MGKKPVPRHRRPLLVVGAPGSRTWTATASPRRRSRRCRSCCPTGWTPAPRSSWPPRQPRDRRDGRRASGPLLRPRDRAAAGPGAGGEGGARPQTRFGLAGVEVGSNVAGAYLGDARFDPFFAACEAEAWRSSSTRCIRCRRATSPATRCCALRRLHGRHRPVRRQPDHGRRARALPALADRLQPRRRRAGAPAAPDGVRLGLDRTASRASCRNRPRPTRGASSTTAWSTTRPTSSTWRRTSRRIRSASAPTIPT